MSAKTFESKFRNVDVDEYDEDRYEEDENAEAPIEKSPDKAEVHNLLQSTKNAEALAYVLDNAPIGSKNQSLLDACTQLIVEVMMSFKTSAVEQALKSLNQGQLDLLLKYVYKGFESPVENSSYHLLIWHDKIYSIGGCGSILRVLTERKRL
ncbi:DgyrCDS6325 [Dimorphilus gyrociliatus]|uniref:Actin-related protein 2/3 complex subunit 5 n=1 Tax=Dimorphilus gyrociliatus TaxID=2664684 RepID=A0A7I8VPC5_9ANNE|nr:DgyrCDS6325 [Dimorphilus gyrociliatus]